MSLRPSVTRCAATSALALSATLGISTLLPSASLAQVPNRAEVQQQQQQQPANGKAMAAVEDLSRAFRNVGQIIEPSVVSIKIHKTITPPAGSRMPRGGGGGPVNPFFRRFFDQDGDGESDIPGFGGPPFGGELIGQGAGVIVAVDGNTGYILTNNHVAGDADEMEVSLNDGRTLDNGKIVGKDPRTDLAVVKIEASNLKAAKWGNSDELEKGDWVLAFGSPFGYVGSMTHGIVSATNRTDLRIIPQGYESFIQIDAPINPGNSGGPLVNIRGEVVGINTAIATRTGGFQGIGFAIPSNQAKQIYTILREKGKVVRGWLGVSIASVSEPESRDVARSFGYKGKNGVLVQQTFPNTPATGKLQEGDIITKLNGKDVTDANDLRNTIAMMAPGTDAKMEVFRDGKTQEVTVKVGDQPSSFAGLSGGGRGPSDEAEPEQGESPKIGLALEDMTPVLARRFGLGGNQQGAIVVRVAPGSPAVKADINPGDVITKVGNDTVTGAIRHRRGHQEE